MSISFSSEQMWNVQSHRVLYLVAAAAALAAVLVALADIIITFFPAGAAPDPGAGTVVDWFMLFERSQFMGLRGLGLLNIVNMICTVVVVFTLYVSHQRISSMLSAVALVVYLAATIIYISNNAALPFATLSQKYATASTDTQRALIESAEEALLARGEDFTPGSFMGFILSELGLIAISIVMLRGRLFSRASAFTGMAGFVLLALFTVWATFIPYLYDVAMLMAVVGGLLSLAWYAMTARHFVNVARLNDGARTPGTAARELQLTGS